MGRLGASGAARAYGVGRRKDREARKMVPWSCVSRVSGGGIEREQRGYRVLLGGSSLPPKLLGRDHLARLAVLSTPRTFASSTMAAPRSSTIHPSANLCVGRGARDQAPCVPGIAGVTFALPGPQIPGGLPGPDGVRPNLPPDCMERTWT